jgi:hypothetical protein
MSTIAEAVRRMRLVRYGPNGLTKCGGVWGLATSPIPVPYADVCRETAYGSTVRLSFAIRCF